MIATVVLVALGLVAATWLLGGLERLSASDGPGRSRSGRTGNAAAAPAVSVIIPARNEAATLPTLLESLERSRRPPLEIIVVDDDSDDGTGDEARRLGATTVIRTSPEPGWLGKTWACHVGALVASGDVLVFLDADTRLSPGALGALADELATRGGLVSVQPYHTTVRPYEELSAYCSAVAMLGSGAFAAPRPVGRATAFGPCLVTSAADYHAAGGHGAVRGAVVEDIHLAGRYAAAGRAVSSLAGGDAVRFRMYPVGLGQLVEGWGKNISTGAALASPLAVGPAVLWVASHAAVAVATVAGVRQWAVGDDDFPLVLAALWVVVAVHLRVILRSIGSFRWWTAAAFPIPLAAFLVIFARSFVTTTLRRQVRWRGRTVAVPSRRGC